MNEKIFDKKLLDVLICPVTKEQLIYNEKNNELIAKKARLAYPLRNGIPIMLENEARKLAKHEK